MQREIEVTADGSHTISLPEMNVTYHSTHGAFQESRHVFIEAGLMPLLSQENILSVSILEIGLGTGLNALLSWQTARQYNKPVNFFSIEPYPILPEQAANLNHGKLLSMEREFDAIHNSSWEEVNQLDDLFILKKMKTALIPLDLTNPVNCIYFDAFSPTVQPELWTQPVFAKMLSCLLPGGTLLTYCSKSVARHAMTAAGFKVEKIQGPWGKREMVRAWRV